MFPDSLQYSLIHQPMILYYILTYVITDHLTLFCTSIYTPVSGAKLGAMYYIYLCILRISHNACHRVGT